MKHAGLDIALGLYVVFVIYRLPPLLAFVSGIAIFAYGATRLVRVLKGGK